MKRTRWLLIGLLLLAGGCARRDWVQDLLVLADVSGTWKGTFFQGSAGPGGRIHYDVTLTLQQKGPKVTGELITTTVLLRGSVEGTMNGDVLIFRSARLRGQATVDGDQMTGEGSTTTPERPFTIRLERQK